MSGNTDSALLRIGESTAEAVAGVLRIFCPEDGQIGDGLVAAVPPGTHPMEGIPTPAVATGVSYVDGVTGGNVFVMTIKGARRLAASMMGAELPDDDAELTELDLSAMGEAMNQMMSSAAMATSKVLGKEVEIAPPEIHQLTDASVAVEAFDTTPQAITAQFSVLGEPCRLVQFIPNAFIVRMNRALSELTTEYASEYQDGPLSPLVQDVPLRVWAELGRVRMPLSSLVGLPASAVVELDREVEDPIDLYVDDLRFATGRLLVTGENEWAVRIESVHGVSGTGGSPEPPQLASSSPVTHPPSTTTEGD
jgi:flagellar motor switch protein FliN/FliY